jgi:transposase
MLGIDLGKNLCSLAGLDETGAVVLRRRMKRAALPGPSPPANFVIDR